MTAFQLKQEIEALRNTDIPVLVRDQKGSTFAVAGLQTDLNNEDTELAFVLRIQTPEQPDLYRKSDVMPLVRVLKKVRTHLNQPLPANHVLTDVQMAIEHAQDLGLNEDK